MALAGAAAEQLFCGSSRSGRRDDEVARRYLAEAASPAGVEAEVASLRAWAAWLVRTPWGRKRNRLVAEALLVHGTLDREAVKAICGSRRVHPSELIVEPDPRPGGERHDAAKSVRAGDHVAT
jgi:hypothetical protein